MNKQKHRPKHEELKNIRCGNCGASSALDCSSPIESALRYSFYPSVGDTSCIAYGHPE
jgi:hypothetical protein